MKQQYGTSVKVTFLRPYDEATRARMVALMERAGATVSRVFMAPLDYDEVVAHLNRVGASDRIVCPFHAQEGQNGIEVLAELAKRGIVRRVVMPVKFGAPLMVKQRIARELPAYAKDVHPFAVDDADLQVTRDAIAAWLGGSSALAVEPNKK
jgi:hypothetical protein